MPKKPTQKKPAKKKTTNTHWLAHHKFLTIFGVIILLGIAAWVSASVYHQVQVNRERAKFMAVKTDLHELAQDISSTVGKPTTSKEVQSCNYASAEFGLGALSCSLAIEFTHIVSTDNEQKNLIYSTNQVIQHVFDVDIKDNSSNLLPSEKNTVAAYIFSFEKMYCGASFVKTNQIVKTTIDCTKNALQPYFPVTDGSDYLP
jgi:hypothetical protein